MKRNSTIREAFDFKDVLLIPRETNIKPEDVSTKTRLTKVIHLEIPLIAAGRDNVTESTMAITMARLGGIGVIHDNMPLGKQVEEVRRVKRAESDIVTNPITIAPEASVAEAFDLMATYKISGLPVIDQSTQKVVGIITNRDIRFFEDYAKPVSELMTKNVITAKGTVEKELAKKILHQHRIEKLVLVDEQDRCIGLLTVKDIERAALYPKATRDTFGRLRVGAMVGIGKEAFERSAAMTDAGLDVLFIDVAHAHTREAIGTVSRIRQQRTNEVQIVVGNVVTADAARSFIDAGADAIKVGIGASDGSASRTLSGIGMPQMTAILDVVEQCEMMNVPVIVEGGIIESSSLAKAIAAGAESVVIDSLFAGTDEAPGEICYQNGQAFKVVNPLAKAQHRPLTSTVQKDAYHFDEDALDTSTPYRGGVSYMTAHLLSGLKFAMAYTGSKDIKSMIENAEFVYKK
jgi:IMP dehydrogenase